MKKYTLRIIGLSAVILLFGAGCLSKKTAPVTTSNTNTTVLPTTNTRVSGSTTGDFSTDTNTTANTTPQTTIVTITAAGVSPKSLTVSLGTTVSFVNADTIAHQISSDPHPSHTGLPGFDNTSQNQSYSFTFTKKGSFGYHDHLDGFNSAMKGTIVVQ